MTLDSDCSSYKLKRGNLKAKFTRRCKTYKDRHSKDDPVDVLNVLYENVLVAFTELETICDQFIDFLVINDYSQSEIQDAHDYLANCESEKFDIHTLNIKYVISSVKPKMPDASLMKLEPLKIPIFDGDIRKFPTFIDDVKTIIVPKYGENPCALRQCLGEIPATTIIGCEKSYEQIMAKLEEVYGDPRKLVDIVINDLKSLTVVADNDNIGFINTVTVIERCHLDLQKVSLDKEMNNVTIVSMIEKFLPKSVKRDWILLSDAIVDKTDLFLKLLKFLLKEKRVIEYSNDNVRNANSEKNNVHALTYNNQPDVYDAIKQMKEDQINTNKILNDICDKMKFNSNVTSVKKCWVHEFDGHHISTCGKFRSMSSSEKLEMAKRKGICYRCLGDKHLSRFCNSQELCNIKTNGQNCNKPHHYLLHESFTIPVSNIIMLVVVIQMEHYFV